MNARADLTVANDYKTNNFIESSNSVASGHAVNDASVRDHICIIGDG